MKDIRRLAVLYLWIQSVGVAAWWIWIVASPSARRLFIPDDLPSDLILGFMPADVPLLAVLGAIAAIGLNRQRAWGWPLLVLHAGAGLYAALVTIGICVYYQGAWVGVALMLPILVIPPYLAWRLR